MCVICSDLVAERRLNPFLWRDLGKVWSPEALKLLKVCLFVDAAHGQGPQLPELLLITCRRW